MNIEDDDLTPEERAFERELAQRLARDGAQREPSPALDARILAAAHAATRPMRAPARRRRAATWPAVFGFAASLAFALGVAWKLRPHPEPVLAPQAEKTGEDALADYAPPAPAEVYAPRPKRVLEVPAPPPAERPAHARGPGSTSARVARRADQGMQPPYAFEAAPATPAPAAPPPPAAAVAAAPVAGAAAPAANASLSAQAAADAATQRREAADAQAHPLATPRMQEARKAAADIVLDESDAVEPDEEVVPPATADSPQVRDAWLQRIRELARTGRLDEARASLREFRHRYPGVALPDDLRALGE